MQVGEVMQNFLELGTLTDVDHAVSVLGHVAPTLNDAVFTRLWTTFRTLSSFLLFPGVLPGTPAVCSGMQSLLLEKPFLCLFFLLTISLIFLLLSFDQFTLKLLLLLLMFDWIQLLLTADRLGGLVA